MATNPSGAPAAPAIMPTDLTVAGHSFVDSTFLVPDNSFRMDQILRGMLGIGQNSVQKYAILGSVLCGDGGSSAGYANILQHVTRPLIGGPYIGRGGAYLNCWGINDPGTLIPSADFGTKTVYAQIRNAFKHALRTVISRERAATVFEAGGAEQAAAWAFGAGFADTAGNAFNSGTGFRLANALPNANATFTIPADFPGGTWACGFTGAAGPFGGTVAVAGTFSKSGAIANFSTSNLMPNGGPNHGHYLLRIPGLLASDAGKTITLTVTQLDGGGGVIIVDYAQIEAVTSIPLVEVCDIPRLLNNAAYASNYPGSYWANAGNNGASGDADVADFNAAIREVIAEFDQFVFQPSPLLDFVIGKQAANYGSDGLHPSANITPACGFSLFNGFASAPAQPGNKVPDNRPSMGRRKFRGSKNWFKPDVAGMTAALLNAVTGNAYFMPFEITEMARRLDGLALEVTTAATGGGGNVRLGIFDDLNGYPYARLADDGLVAITALGEVAILTPNSALDPGQYHLCLLIEAQGVTIAGTLRAYTGDNQLLPVSTVAAAPAAGAFIGNTAWLATGMAAGGFPQQAPAGMTLIASAAPLLYWRESKDG